MVVNQELCIGCEFCLDACPAQALIWIDPYSHEAPAAGRPGYSPGQPTGRLPRTMAKCTLCSERISAGLLPVCVTSCANGALWVGNMDRNTATNGREVRQLSQLLAEHPCKVREVQFGTGSRLVFLS